MSHELSKVDPELRAPLTWPMRTMCKLGISRATLPIMRAVVRKLGTRPPLEQPGYEERWIPTSQGDSPPVRVLLVNPQPS